MNPFRIVKYFLLLIPFGISSAQSSYSNGFTGDAEEFIDFYGVGDNKGFIIYEFGFSKINSVYIVKKNTHLDVYISDGNKVSFSTSCEMSPILNWAFEKAPEELAAVRFVTNEEYEPLYYKLTIMVDCAPIIIDSSSMRIIGKEAVVKKIDELKRYIISLWIDSFPLRE